MRGTEVEVRGSDLDLRKRVWKDNIHLRSPAESAHDAEHEVKVMVSIIPK